MLYFLFIYQQADHTFIILVILSLPKLGLRTAKHKLAQGSLILVSPNWSYFGHILSPEFGSRFITINVLFSILMYHKVCCFISYPSSHQADQPLIIINYFILSISHEELQVYENSFDILSFLCFTLNIFIHCYCFIAMVVLFPLLILDIVSTIQGLFK